MNISEMSHIIDTSKIPLNGMEFVVEASETEAKKIAERLGIVNLSDFKSHVFVTKEDLITVRAAFTAQVIQKDVVTGDDVSQSIDDSFEENFIDEKAVKEPFDVDDLDSPEIIENHELDSGELLIQYLALSLDAFPRNQDDAEFIYHEGEEKENPFLVLKKLKKD